MISHKRASTVLPSDVQQDDLSSQIDRLNQALEVVMKEIEISNVSRNPSRMSALTLDFFNETQPDQTDEVIKLNYDSTIENLLTSLDRQQMVIEDFCSEENRKQEKSKKFCNPCLKSVKSLRQEIWAEFSQKKTERNEKEKQMFEERIKALDEIKSEYLEKTNDVMTGVEKLKLKERLLAEKEKELRTQRLNFDKQKNAWEKENGIETTVEIIKPEKHVRANSFSYIESPSMASPEKISKGNSNKQELLRSLQEELKSLQSGAEDNGKDIRIEGLKNQIARIRADIAMNESNKATRLIYTMMTSMQKEVERDEKIKRIELMEAATKNIVNSIKTNIPIKPKPLETCKPDIDAPRPKNNMLQNVKNKNSSVLDKEKELAARELFLQQTWMRVPGAKELIENVNMTLAKLTQEKMMFERERDEFDREKREWINSKRKK